MAHSCGYGPLCVNEGLFCDPTKKTILWCQTHRGKGMVPAMVVCQETDCANYVDMANQSEHLCERHLSLKIAIREAHDDVVMQAVARGEFGDVPAAAAPTLSAASSSAPSAAPVPVQISIPKPSLFASSATASAAPSPLRFGGISSAAPCTFGSLGMQSHRSPFSHNPANTSQAPVGAGRPIIVAPSVSVPKSCDQKRVRNERFPARLEVVRADSLDAPPAKKKFTIEVDQDFIQKCAEIAKLADLKP